MTSFIALCLRPNLRLFAAAALSLGLAACSSTGSVFDSSALRFIVAGQTTLEEASSLLQADPTDIYRQQDGSAMARWSHKNSLLTDAIYLNQELWLNFGPDGYFQKVVKSVNLPLIDTHDGGRRVNTPPVTGQAGAAATRPAGGATVTTSTVSTRAVGPLPYPAAAPASIQADPAPDDAINGVIYKPAVSYPLPQ